MGPGVGAQRRGPVPKRMSDENHHVCVCAEWLALGVRLLRTGCGPLGRRIMQSWGVSVGR